MMHFAHLSDLHFCPKYLVEANRCLSYAVDRINTMPIDAAVITGDTTDHALDVHSPAVEALLRNVRRLADRCPVLILQGTYSHEPPGMLSVFRYLGGRYPIHVADRIEQVALTTDGRWFKSDSWRFRDVPRDAKTLFSCVPTVNKATVAAALGATNASSAVGEQLNLLLRGFAVINGQARQRNISTVGLSHGTVFGCVTEHDVPMAGFDHEFTTQSLFDSGVRAFMLGHIHRHQMWERDGQTIAYPGSIGCYHYGEKGSKGFLLWQVDADTAACTLEPTPARRTIDLVFAGKPDLDVIRNATKEHDIDGAFVRVRWTIPDEDRHEVDRAAIQRALVGAAEVELDGRILPVVRTRAAGIAAAKSMADKVKAWAKAVEANPDPLLSLLESLQYQTPDQIAESILALDALQDQIGEEAPMKPDEPEAVDG